MDAGPTDGSLAVDALAGLLFLGPDGHLGLDGDGHCLLSEELNRLGDIYGGGVPLALFLLLRLSQRGELVHDVFQRGLLAILLLLW